MPQLLRALKDFPVVLIQGPRQCGKTTLAHMLNSKKEVYKYISFDNESIAKTAQDDPIGFIHNLPKRVILDEVQKAPEIFPTLKTVIDKNRKPGRFILTGSASVLHLPRLSESLAGRMCILRLYPFSQNELSNDTSCFFKSIFKKKIITQEVKPVSLSLLIDKITKGGYPVALKLPTETRVASWYTNYINTLIQKDIRDISQMRAVDILPNLLTLCATQTAHLLNFSRLASAFQVSRSSIVYYISLLEHMFFLEKLQPWFHNRLSRIIKTPKIHISDTGLACALLKINKLSLQKDPILLGQLAETFVFQELKKQASYSSKYYDFFHYRNRKGHEIDIIIEHNNEILGIEVKLSSTIRSSDFNNLRRLKNIIGKQFARGVLIYTGNVCMCIEKELFAMPISYLWTPP